MDTVSGWARDEEITRFLGGVLDEQGAQDLLRRWIASMDKAAPLGRRALCRVEDDVLVGYCGLWPLPNYPERGVELSYGLGKAWWRQGYAIEAARAMLAHGFAYDLDEILASIHPDNSGSLAVAKKLGMNHVEDIDWPGYGQVRLYAKRREE